MHSGTLRSGVAHISSRTDRSVVGLVGFGLMFKQRSSVHFIHYLDDFLWVHKNFKVCVNTSKVVKEMSAEIGHPLAPEKFVEPTQSLTFLGLVLDSVHMAVAIPRDKQDKIEKQLLEMISAKKTTVKKVQALAGSLNFITRAVPHGRPFMQKMYNLCYQ